MEIRDLLHHDDDGLLALCALLLEMAHIDGEFSDKEAIALIDLLSEQLAQSVVRGEALLIRARGMLRVLPDTDSLAARLRDQFSLPERGAIVGLLWEIAMADGYVDPYERYFAYRIGTLLGVTDNEIRQEHRHATQRLRKS